MLPYCARANDVLVRWFARLPIRTFQRRRTTSQESRMPRDRCWSRDFFVWLHKPLQNAVGANFWQSATDTDVLQSEWPAVRRCARRRRDTGFAEEERERRKEREIEPTGRDRGASLPVRPWAARPFRLDIAPLSSSTTIEIPRESVG